MNACFVPKEVTAEASEACVVTANLCAAWCLCPWLCPESAQGFIPFSVVLVPALVLDSGVEWAGSGGQGAVAGGIEAVVLPPGSWAASVPGLSQDLSAPDPAPSCGVGWAELECSHWEMIHCVFLPRGCVLLPRRRAFLWCHPVCAATKSTVAGPVPAMGVPTVGSEVQPGPHPRPSRLSSCSWTESSSRVHPPESRCLATVCTCSPTWYVFQTRK